MVVVVVGSGVLRRLLLSGEGENDVAVVISNRCFLWETQKHIKRSKGEGELKA